MADGMLRGTGKFNAWASAWVLAAILASCQTSPPDPGEPPVEPLPPAIYSTKHDEEFQQILRLARRNRWDEAKRRSDALAHADPGDPAVKRLVDWVDTRRQVHRERALEDSIRAIESDDSVFNPTIPKLLKEEKDRGLPPRQDVRDAVKEIETTPYVPASYGKTIRKRGDLFGLDQEDSRTSRLLDKEISIHAENLTLKDIIFNVGESEGINFVADKSLPAFEKKLSVNMDGVKLREFLRYVARNLELQFQTGEDLIWIVDGKDPKNRLEETRFYRLREGFVMPAQLGPWEVNRSSVTRKGVTTVTVQEKMNRFVNDGAGQIPSIEVAIKEFFAGSEGGPKYMMDYERNLIVARGTREELELLEKIIEEFDRPIQQVLIEARFITVSEAAFMELGVAWETGRTPTLTRGVEDFTGLSPTDNPVLGLQETFTNVLSRANLSATISALEQTGESQTLSAPRLTLINNLPATIRDGKVQYYYEEYSVKQEATEQRSVSALVPSGKPTTITSGVQLDVIASISGDGQSILLGLRPRVNQEVELVTFATITDVDRDGNIISTFDIKLPESRTQELATRVVVKSGQTVVMGGVLERDQTTYVESVPGLGNIPVLGFFFRKRTEVDKPRYLLIFVTATIISESGEYITYEGGSSGV